MLAIKPICIWLNHTFMMACLQFISFTKNALMASSTRGRDGNRAERGLGVVPYSLPYVSKVSPIPISILHSWGKFLPIPISHNAHLPQRSTDIPKKMFKKNKKIYLSNLISLKILKKKKRKRNLQIIIQS